MQTVFVLYENKVKLLADPATREMQEVNLQPDTFKIWEPKIIGIVLTFPARSSTEMGTPIWRTTYTCVLPCAYEKAHDVLP